MLLLAPEDFLPQYAEGGGKGMPPLLVSADDFLLCANIAEEMFAALHASK
jgi:hypothetical protein